MSIEGELETSVARQEDDVTFGVVRPLEAEINILPLQSIENTLIHKRFKIEGICFLNTSWKP